MARTFRSLAFAAPLLLLAACGSQPAKPDIVVTDVWARAIAPGQTTGAAYMTIANEGDAGDRLLSAKVSLSQMSSLHTTRTANGITSMEAVGALDIPAKSIAKLAPGGTHLMIMNLAVPMSAGDRFFVDFKFEKSGIRTVAGKIVAAGSR